MEVRTGVVLAALSLSLFSYCCSAASLITPQNILNGTVGGEITFNLSIDPVDQTATGGTWRFGPKIVVTWTNSSIVYTKDYIGRVEVSNVTGSLKFNKLFAADSGEYTVTITTAPSSLNLNGRVELKVYEPVSEIKIKPQPEKPTENENFSLTCEADHADSFLWMKDGQSLDTNGTISLSDKNQTVFFTPLLQSYNGTYTCMAFNIVSNETSKGYTLVMNSNGQIGKSLTTNGIVAIAVCCVLLVLAVTALVIFLLMRQRRSSTGASKSSSPTTKPEDGLVYSTPTFLKEPGDRKSTQNADPNTQYANISKQPQVQSNTATEYAELRRK